MPERAGTSAAASRNGSPPRLRQCAVTREMKPVEEMIRFVRDPQNQIIADLRHKLPGRGVWVTADRAHLEQAVAKNVFARSFRANVKLGKNLPGQVRELYERRALELLAMANKAGELVTGFEKVAAEIATGNVAVLLHASGASPDGCGKLDAKFAAIAGERAARVTIGLHSSDNLSAVTGKTNVVHAAVKTGGLARSYLQNVRILAQLGPKPEPGS